MAYSQGRTASLRKSLWSSWSIASWWFQPIWKNIRQIEKIFPNFRGEHEKISETTYQQTLPITPWKINMEPENDGLEDDFPFQLGEFLVPC